MKLYILLIFLDRVVCMTDGIKDLLTPDHDAGEFCGYEVCPAFSEGILNVHIVPHTHYEFGQIHTFDEHFTGVNEFAPMLVNMRRTLDVVLTELWTRKYRTFTLSDIAYLFKWWEIRDPTVHRMFYELVRQGRIFLVGGGWSMSDEASASYHAVIDHYTYSLRKTNSTFLECARPLVSWQAESFGHSKEFASLMAMMGFDGHFISPISYDDEIIRMNSQDLEFIWRGSDDLGSDTEIFTHKLFDGFWSPPGFCFGNKCEDPLIIETPAFTNVEERVKDFIDTVRNRQAPHYKTNHVMVMMGTRYGFYDAKRWYDSIDSLIFNTNKYSLSNKENITLFYSTPACYLKAIYKENPRLSVKTDDIMPVAYNKNTYFSGLFTSRPTLKRVTREGHALLQVFKQLQVLSNIKMDERVYEDYHWIMGILQDHNVLSGGLTQRVMEYYMVKLKRAMDKSLLSIGRSINKLRGSSDNIAHHRCDFNISHCPYTNYEYFYIVVYNPLAWTVTVPIRLPVQKADYVVTLPNMTSAQSALIDKPNFIKNLQPSAKEKQDYELIFLAEELPPFGFRSYHIQKHSRQKRAIYRKETKNEKMVYNRKNREFNSRGEDFNEYDGDLDDLDNIVDDLKRNQVIDNNFFISNTKDFTEDKLRVEDDDNDVELPTVTTEKYDDYMYDDYVATVNAKSKASDKAKSKIKANDLSKSDKTTTTEDNDKLFRKSMDLKETVVTRLPFFDVSRTTSLGTTTQEPDEETITELTTTIETSVAPTTITTLPTTTVPTTTKPKTTKTSRKRISTTHNRRLRPVIDLYDPSLTKKRLKLTNKLIRPTKNTTPKVPKTVKSYKHGSRPLLRYFGKEATNPPKTAVTAKKTFISEVTESPKLLAKPRYAIKVTKPPKFSVTAKQTFISEVTPLPNSTVTPKQSFISEVTKRPLLPFTAKASFISEVTKPIQFRATTKHSNIAGVTKPPKPRATAKQSFIEEPTLPPAFFATTKPPKPRPTAKQSYISEVLRPHRPRPSPKQSFISEVTKPRPTAKQSFISDVNLFPKMTTLIVTRTPSSEVTRTTEMTTFHPTRVTLPPKLTRTPSYLNLRPTLATKDVKHKETTAPTTEETTDQVTEATTELVEVTTEQVTEATTELGTESTTELGTESTTELNTKVVTEATTELNTETTIEQVTEMTTEQTTNATTEPVTESTTEMVAKSTTEQVRETTNPTITTVTETTTSQTPEANQTTTQKVEATTPQEEMTYYDYPIEGEHTTQPTPGRRMEVIKSSMFYTTQDRYIKNQYITVHLDSENQIEVITLANGLRINLKIDVFYYVSDDPVNLGKATEVNPGAYVFRPIDPYAVQVKSKYTAKVVKNSLVEELRVNYGSFVDFCVRIYKDSPVVEVDWLVGPVPIDEPVPLGKEVFIRYSTDLHTDDVFYTDSNGRQSVRRKYGDKGYDATNPRDIANNFYPVTSKIYIEDLFKNIRFTLFNDRAQGGSSKDGAIDIMVHRRILTDDAGFRAFINETADGKGIQVRGKHYLYFTKAVDNKNLIFTKKFAKQVELSPEIFVANFVDVNKWGTYKNEFVGIKKLPVGINCISLEQLDRDSYLIRLENYLEKKDLKRSGVRTVFLKDLFVNFKVLAVEEVTLGANKLLVDHVQLKWRKNGKEREDLKVGERVDLEAGVKLKPQEIRTFIATVRLN